MSLYKLAIVGRPNVGKSSLFNKICKKNISIVHEREGVTRDRIYSKAYFQKKPFIAIDTAGIDFNRNFSLEEQLNMQAQIAIAEADILIMVVDVKVGVTNLDKEVAKNLLKTEKKVILAINKVDIKDYREKVFEFQDLGIKEMVSISATQNYQIDTLLNRAFEDKEFDENYIDQANSKKINIAIVGRTNVGKSTLLNSLLNKERSIVSEKRSTTRDSIDSEIIINKKPYIFIDTAGIRRKNKENDVLEKFSHTQTIKSIKKSDVCLLVLDALDFITFQDKKIMKTIEKYAKGLIIIVNKWDRIKDVKQEHFINAIKEKISKHFPVLIISAKERKNLNKIFPLIEKVQKNRNKFIQTASLNKFIET